MNLRSSKEPRWIPRTAVLAIQEALLAAHGGAAGVRDEGLLDSALASPRNLLAYGTPDLFQLAAAYAHALTPNHPFRDGNKRIALTVAGVFLERNGWRLEATEVDAVRAMLAMATREVDEVQFADWLRESCAKIERAKTQKGSSARKETKRRVTL